MDTQRLCEQCAASNTGDALFCWQCFAPFPTAGSVIAADARSGALPTAGPYLGPPPASGGWLRNHGLLVIIVGAVLIAVSLGGLFVWSVWRGGSLRLPESIAGYSRDHDKAYEDRFAKSAGAQGLTATAAAYRGQAKAFVVVVFSGGGPPIESPDFLFEQVASQTQSDGRLTVDTLDENEQFDRVDGSTTICAPVTGAASGSLFLWTDTRFTGWILGSNIEVAENRALVGDARRAIAG